MDRLESMSILVTAVEAGSLSAAARRIGMPLATVSRKVSDLEAHLKTRLFNRSSRRLSLTDAGRSYVAACKRILEDVGEAERARRVNTARPKATCENQRNPQANGASQTGGEKECGKKESTCFENEPRPKDQNGVPRRHLSGAWAGVEHIVTLRY